VGCDCGEDLKETKLRPFQIEGVQQIYRFKGRVLLADEMGLGKTIQALYWIKKIPKRRPVVIIAPASMKYVWQSEAALHFGMRTEVLEGHHKGQRPQLISEDIIIINYDILRSWLPSLLKADPQCVILDECHYIKNKDAKRTKAALQLTENASSVLGLSGTPLTNRPIELWTILKAIRPDLFPDHNEYAWRYCKPRWTRWGWVYDGAVRTPELHKILRRECMIRRLKKDVLTELPDKTRQMVPFRLKSYEEYDQAENDFLLWLRRISPQKAQRAKRAEALAKMGYLIRLAARLKMDWTERWIEEFYESHPGEKLVAMTCWTFVIDHLKQKFGDRAVVIDGRVTGRQREETRRCFQSNKRVDLLLGNWRAAGIGITLTAASNLASLDLPWTPGDLLQGEDRIHRIGQKMKVVIHYLMALDTIEEKQVNILRKKTKILDAILDGKRPAKDLNIFDALIERMTK